jgi:glycosyltransferase involved in cell wall biosynthesis
MALVVQPIDDDVEGPGLNDTGASETAASVVIPVRNSASTLGVQLGALALQKEAPPFEVIVADNGSTDDTANVVGRWTALLPALRMIDASHRPGPCAARNLGAAAARSSKLLFCDADDAVQPGWVRTMADALDNHVVVGGKMRDDALNAPEVRAWFPDIPVALFTKFDLMPYASGANIAIRREALDAVGGWDETLANATDADVCFRIQRDLGTELGFAPDAVVQYRYRSDLRGLYANMRRYGRADYELLERHRHAGMRAPSLTSHVRWVGWLVVHAPDLVRDRSSRGGWVRRFGLTIGRLEGTMALARSRIVGGPTTSRIGDGPTNERCSEARDRAAEVAC